MKSLSVRSFIIRALAFSISFLFLLLLGCREKTNTTQQDLSKTTSMDQKLQYVFDTKKVKRYRFPTHINDLVIDRAQSSHSEVFMVVIEPNHAPPLHKHDDTEQVFYVIEGTGVLTIGTKNEQYPVKPGDVVRIPVSTFHSIRANSKDTLRYLCVDCFKERPIAEPTWDDHVKTVCKNNSWDYTKVVSEQ